MECTGVMEGVNFLMMFSFFSRIDMSMMVQPIVVLTKRTGHIVQVQ